jgi:hypothetical protein
VGSETKVAALHLQKCILMGMKSGKTKKSAVLLFYGYSDVAPLVAVFVHFFHQSVPFGNLCVCSRKKAEARKMNMLIEVV